MTVRLSQFELWWFLRIKKTITDKWRQITAPDKMKSEVCPRCAVKFYKLLGALLWLVSHCQKKKSLNFKDSQTSIEGWPLGNQWPTERLNTVSTNLRVYRENHRRWQNWPQSVSTSSCAKRNGVKDHAQCTPCIYCTFVYILTKVPFNRGKKLTP